MSPALLLPPRATCHVARVSLPHRGSGGHPELGHDVGVATTGVVVGAGDRGFDAYATLLLDEPELGRIVAVADPDAGRRARFAERYSLGTADCFDGWESLFAGPRRADYEQRPIAWWGLRVDPR